MIGEFVFLPHQRLIKIIYEAPYDAQSNAPARLRPSPWPGHVPLREPGRRNKPEDVAETKRIKSLYNLNFIHELLDKNRRAEEQ